MKIKELIKSINRKKTTKTINVDNVCCKLKEHIIKYYELEEYRDRVKSSYFDNGKYIDFCCYITNGVKDVLSKDYKLQVIAMLMYSKEKEEFRAIDYCYEK